MHKAIYNSIMLYLMALIMTSPEFFKDLENEHINPWPKCNSLALNKMMINIQNKQKINFEYKKGQQNRDIANKPTKYEVQKVSITFYESFKEYKIKDNNEVRYWINQVISAAI